MLLSAIGKREVPIPEHIDIYHLTREMPPSEKTPLECVMEVDTERAMLEREAERLAHEDGNGPGCLVERGHFWGEARVPGNWAASRDPAEVGAEGRGGACSGRC